MFDIKWSATKCLTTPCVNDTSEFRNLPVSFDVFGLRSMSTCLIYDMYFENNTPNVLKELTSSTGEEFEIISHGRSQYLVLGRKKRAFGLLSLIFRLFELAQVSKFFMVSLAMPTTSLPRLHTLGASGRGWPFDANNHVLRVAESETKEGG